MISPDARSSFRLDRMPNSDREQQRLQILEELGLLKTESVPVFEEATQTAAHFLDAPICILGLMDADRLWFKSAIGLSRIGLMNDLAISRQLPRHESFCSQVVESQHVLMQVDAAMDPDYADSLLVQQYGIRSYLGVPLVVSSGHCVGTLAVMGLEPRRFTSKEVELLQLVARWSISEFERNRMLYHAPVVPLQDNPAVSRLEETAPAAAITIPSVKSRLISQMTQELCTPLTSILGMARVLSQGIYGALTEKQKEYIEIIHSSGQYLLSLINEVVDLGSLDDGSPYLNLSAVDVEMLCQQSISALEQAAQRHSQQIRLTVEPGPRIWLLDKDKVRQMLYHLIFGFIQSATPESIIRIHISRKNNLLHLMIWASHPWLGDGLPPTELTPNQLVNQWAMATGTNSNQPVAQNTWVQNEGDGNLDAVPPVRAEVVEPAGGSSRQSLGLMLSQQLAELHGGCITVQGLPEEGYRYVIKLPQLKNQPEREMG